MGRHLGLKTKVLAGFGTLMLLTAGLGVVGWTSVGQIEQKMSLDKAGGLCLNQLDACAALRRDFAARGFTIAQGQTKSADARWEEAFGEFSRGLTQLGGMKGLASSESGLVTKARAESEEYRKWFQAQVASRKLKDQAFATWGELGWKITSDVQAALTQTIQPAINQARQSKDAEAISKWSAISDGVCMKVVQPFLLLRVCAVYLRATGADEQWTAFEKQTAVTLEGLKQWTAEVQDTPAIAQLATTLKGYIEQYQAAGQSYHEGMLAERTAENAMAGAAVSVVSSIKELRKSLERATAATTARCHQMVIAVPVVAIIIGVVLATILSSSIMRPFRRIFRGLESFSVAELESTGDAFNRIINGMKEGVDQVNDAAGQVASAAQQLAEGASEQASSLEQTSAALQEISAMTRTNAGSAKQANVLATQTRDAAGDGEKGMSAINGSSDQISRIIKVIEGIAFQTNLLALNAAVEAARAGEHGKGFAVVADEVRNLAQRAAQAARETTELISGSVGASRQGTTAIHAIVSNVAQLTGLIDSIAKASDDQAEGVEQVNTAVSQMDRVTQKTAAGAEESASAAEELSAQAEGTKHLVDELMLLVLGQGQGQSQKQSPSSRPTPVARPATARKPVSPKTPEPEKPKKRFALAAKATKPRETDAALAAQVPELSDKMLDLKKVSG
jgi:methyl-accepting chemotaxis protein